ncbi:amidohydrolase family protein [Myxococcus sp. RHSTA-1-4]|uniref:amidohydrolase family protein n=1 Tax=Myxococcus sp. RHSTA-1-4 TaxID=2874601 RepID=UPI001CBA88C2|nr:amidohydrolase family protein [Myxococcus sp. RHSTA-1-4]MBZ4420622.1 amidohydrolase [Myxococcus sp. RHSTA-1-4]
MAKRPRILDVDAHVVEPSHVWTHSLPRGFRERMRLRAPEPRARTWQEEVEWRARLVLACEREGLDVEEVEEAMARAEPGLQYLEVDGVPLLPEVARQVWAPLAAGAFTRYLPLIRGGFDGASFAEVMRAMGVERAFFYPTVFLLLLAVDDMEPGFAATLMRAYNDWLRGFCAADPGFLHGVGALCRHEPEAMVREVERIAEWGWKAVMVHPQKVKGRLLSDPAFEPFWTRCEELGIAVGLHGGAHMRLPDAGTGHVRTQFGIHAAANPMQLTLALLTLLEGGVLERHPGLRVGLLEGGCGWLPFWLWRLDSAYERDGWTVSEHVRRKPSEYFARQCFITCEPSEPGIEQVIDMVGEDCVLYASDFPHLDHPPHVQEDASLLAERLGSRVAGKILWDNGCRFYGVRG